MSDYCGSEPVFKKPALPSRYQRTNSYNRACSEISNASEYSSNKVREKIEVLERAFPPNDDIWENLVKNIDHLCFIKLSESVLQPNSQRSSSINNGNPYPNVLTQRTSSNHRFNSTSSTINTQADFTAQPNLRNVVPVSVSSSSQYHVVRSRNVEKFDDVNSRNTVTERHYSSHRLLVPNETFQAVRSSRSKSTSSSSTTTEEENDSTLQSQSRIQSTSELNVVVPLPKKRATASKKTETSSKVDKRRSQSAESSYPERRKRSKKEETVKESTQRVSSSSKTATKPARQNRSQPQKKSLDLNGSNDSVLTFFRKQRQFKAKKPSPVTSSAGVPTSAKEKQGATRKTQDSQSSQSEEDSQESSLQLSQNIVTVIKKSANTRKTKTAGNTQQSEAVESRVKKPQTTVSREESISEDDCSQTRKTSAVRTGNVRNPSKTKTAPVKKPTVRTRKVETTPNSPSLGGISDSDELGVDITLRKKNQKTKDANDVRPRRTVKKMHYGEVSDSNASQDVTPQETKILRKPADPKKTNRTKSSSLKKPKLTAARSKTTRVSPVKSSTAVQKKRAEAVLQAKDSSISNSVNRGEGTMGESFFSDVSSIAGNGSVSFLCPEKKRKSKTQPTYEMDGSMQFFSPFTSANLRSTSVFSAASTPLSKSVAKNVLGKRVKKPSVVAELKNELKENRKKKKLQNKPNVIQPIQETTASTESECEASDFSD